MFQSLLQENCDLVQAFSVLQKQRTPTHASTKHERRLHSHTHKKKEQLVLEQNNCSPFSNVFDARVSLCCTAKDNLNLQQSLQKQPACTFTYIALNSSTERRRTLGVLIVERVSRNSTLYTCCTQNDELQIFCKPRDPQNNSTKSSLLRWMRSMFQRLPLT